MVGVWRARRWASTYPRFGTPGWIGRAKRSSTRQKRLEQMLEELKRGDRYMKMRYRPASVHR
jgi:hypothetical protein